MKKIITSIIVVALCFNAFAQGESKGHHGDKSSEKIAFISHKMDLTVEEAEAFWPVYNKIEAEQKALFKAEREARKALRAVLKAEVKDEKAIAKALDEYTAAAKKNIIVRYNYEAQVKKAVGAEKTARYFMAEEQFRNLQIRNLKDFHKGKPGMQPGMQHGMRPGHDCNQFKKDGKCKGDCRQNTPAQNNQ